jgi:hypothetical protein
MAMAESQGDDSIAPRRSLKPILPPPPPELVEEKRREERAREQQAKEKQAAEKRAREDQAREQKAREQKAREQRAKASRAQESPQPTRHAAEAPTLPTAHRPPATETEPASESKPRKERESKRSGARPKSQPRSNTPRRTRRAQLRLVQVDAWSVMKTSFLLSIALGIVLVVAVAIIWTVLGAAGVWDSINSIVQQAVGTGEGNTFDIEDYAGISRVMGFAMIVAVVDVILITAIATLGAFLYNLAAALLGGIEVTLAEDS